MKNGEVDEQAFRKFVNWQIAEGSHGLVPVGTTGESPTLTPEEHKSVIEICIAEAKGRVPVIAGTGSNSTAEAVEYTVHAKEAGADAAPAPVGGDGEGQKLCLIRDGAADEEAARLGQQKGAAAVKKGAQFRGAPRSGIDEACRMDRGERGQVRCARHGRIAGAASRMGAASAWRT